MDEVQRKLELIQDLADIAYELGWVIAIPAPELTPGVVIGTIDYVMDILNDNIDGYEIMALDEESMSSKKEMH
jgi:hypothetical protein